MDGFIIGKKRNLSFLMTISEREKLTATIVSNSKKKKKKIVISKENKKMK